MQFSNQHPAKIKNSRFGYLQLESEPEHDRTQDLSIGLKEELFSNRYFLKHRVWRNMKKVRRQYNKPPGTI